MTSTTNSKDYFATWECMYCNSTFDLEKSVKEHVKQHHPKTKGMKGNREDPLKEYHKQYNKKNAERIMIEESEISSKEELDLATKLLKRFGYDNMLEQYEQVHGNFPNGNINEIIRSAQYCAEHEIEESFEKIGKELPEKYRIQLLELDLEITDNGEVGEGFGILYDNESINGKFLDFMNGDITRSQMVKILSITS